MACPVALTPFSSLHVAVLCKLRSSHPHNIDLRIFTNVKTPDGRVRRQNMNKRDEQSGLVLLVEDNEINAELRERFENELHHC